MKDNLFRRCTNQGLLGSIQSYPILTMYSVRLMLQPCNRVNCCYLRKMICTFHRRVYRGMAFSTAAAEYLRGLACSQWHSRTSIFRSKRTLGCMRLAMPSSQTRRHGPCKNSLRNGTVVHACELRTLGGMQLAKESCTYVFTHDIILRLARVPHIRECISSTLSNASCCLVAARQPC
jgi:hypothetical protein